MTNIALLTAGKVVSEMQNAIPKQFTAIFGKAILVFIMELNLRIKYIFKIQGD